jgi:hypothetical protein
VWAGVQQHPQQARSHRYLRAPLTRHQKRSQNPEPHHANPFGHPASPQTAMQVPESGVAAVDLRRGQAAEHVPGEQVLPGLAGPRTADVVRVGVQPGGEPPSASRRLLLLELPGDRPNLGMKPVEPDERSEIGQQHNCEDVGESAVPAEVK